MVPISNNALLCSTAGVQQCLFVTSAWRGQPDRVCKCCPATPDARPCAGGACGGPPIMRRTKALFTERRTAVLFSVAREGKISRALCHLEKTCVPYEGNYTATFEILRNAGWRHLHSAHGAFVCLFGHTLSASCKYLALSRYVHNQA